MDWNFIVMIFKLIVSLIIILGLMLILVKYSKKGVNSTIGKKYTKIIDRTQISKDSYILVVQIGKSGMVLLTSPNHTERLKELTEEEIIEIEKTKKESMEEMTKVYDRFVSTSKNKTLNFIDKIKSKESKNE